MVRENKINVIFSCLTLKFNSKGKNEDKDYILSL